MAEVLPSPLLRAACALLACLAVWTPLLPLTGGGLPDEPACDAATCCCAATAAVCCCATSPGGDRAPGDGLLLERNEGCAPRPASVATRVTPAPLQLGDGPLLTLLSKPATPRATRVARRLATRTARPPVPPPRQV